MGVPVPSERGPEVLGAQTSQATWKRVGELHISGARVYIGDSWAIRVESIEVPVTPGPYEFDIETFSYGSDERVAMLRGRLAGAVPDGSRDAGEFSVDVASAGVIDADALERWAGSDEAAFDAWQQSFSEGGAADIGLFPCEPIGSAMVYTSTGFGDGTYRVVTLLQEGKPVGFEARFLEEGQGYFEQAGGTPFAPRPISRLKGWFLVISSLFLVAVAFVVAVTLGLIGLVSLGIAKLLSKLR